MLEILLGIIVISLIVFVIYSLDKWLKCKYRTNLELIVTSLLCILFVLTLCYLVGHFILESIK